jgi:hypothetical protein
MPAGPGELLEQHKRYAARFNEWMLGLNRADFMQAKKLLDAMMHAYAKHTMKIHSPPAKKDDANAPGKTSEGSPDSGVPAPGDGDAA